MRKILICLALVAGLVSQGLALAQAMPDIEAAVHAASHPGPAHHHEVDGSAHFDDSNESLSHMQADHGGTVAAAIHEPPRMAAPSPRRGLHRTAAESAPPTPFIEGLHRPPRLIA